MVGFYRELLENQKVMVDRARAKRLQGNLRAWAEIMDAVTAERKIIEEWMAMTKLMAELETSCSCPLENTCYGIRV
jgi:hypothetical protein